MLQLPDVVHQRYQLQQKLGQNASRQTWLAMDLSAQPSQPVILKLLAFNPQMQWEDLKLFEREAVPASDLYALGATFIHLAIGVAPWVLH